MSQGVFESLVFALVAFGAVGVLGLVLVVDEVLAAIERKTHWRWLRDIVDFGRYDE